VQFLGTADQFVAASGAGKVRLLNSKGEESGTLPAGDLFVQALAVSEDGTLAAGGGDDGVLRVWSVKDRKSVVEFGPIARSVDASVSEVR
jgi:WD40 repeat protein